MDSAVWSSSSVTIKLTLYMPAAVNVWTGFTSLEVTPSLKSHRYVSEPSASLEPLPSNSIGNGAVPLVILALATATGNSLALLPIISIAESLGSFTPSDPCASKFMFNTPSVMVTGNVLVVTVCVPTVAFISKSSSTVAPSITTSNTRLLAPPRVLPPVAPQ